MKVKAVSYSILAFILSYFGCFVLENIKAEVYPILMRLQVSLMISFAVLVYYGYRSLMAKIDELKK